MKQIYTYVTISAVIAFFLGFLIAGAVTTGHAISDEKQCSNLFECLFMKKAQEEVQVEEQFQEQINSNPEYYEKDWDDFMSEAEFDSTYGSCAEPIKEFVRENNLVSRDESELNEYERYAQKELVAYIEANGIRERFEAGEKIFLVRESTEGELIPGNIYEEDPSSEFQNRAKKCTYRVTSWDPPNWPVVQHKGWLFWREVKWEDEVIIHP